MVYWIVMSQQEPSQIAEQSASRPVGPFESYDVAREALQRIRTDLTYQINSRIVVDYG